MLSEDSDDCEGRNELQEFAGLLNLLRCPLCRDILKVPCRTACAHSFCDACIRAHLERSEKCPICYVPVMPMDLRGNHVMSNILDTMTQELAKIRALAQEQLQERVAAKPMPPLPPASSPRRRRSHAMAAAARGEDPPAATSRCSGAQTTSQQSRVQCNSALYSSPGKVAGIAEVVNVEQMDDVQDADVDRTCNSTENSAVRCGGEGALMEEFESQKVPGDGRPQVASQAEAAVGSASQSSTVITLESVSEDEENPQRDENGRALEDGDVEFPSATAQSKCSDGSGDRFRDGDRERGRCPSPSEPTAMACEPAESGGAQSELDGPQKHISLPRYSQEEEQSQAVIECIAATAQNVSLMNTTFERCKVDSGNSFAGDGMAEMPPASADQPSTCVDLETEALTGMSEEEEIKSERDQGEPAKEECPAVEDHMQIDDTPAHVDRRADSPFKLPHEPLIASLDVPETNPDALAHREERSKGEDEDEEEEVDLVSYCRRPPIQEVLETQDGFGPTDAGNEHGGREVVVLGTPPDGPGSFFQVVRGATLFGDSVFAVEESRDGFGEQKRCAVDSPQALEACESVEHGTCDEGSTFYSPSAKTGRDLQLEEAASLQENPGSCGEQVEDSATGLPVSPRFRMADPAIQDKAPSATPWSPLLSPDSADHETSSAALVPMPPVFSQSPPPSCTELPVTSCSMERKKRAIAPRAGPAALSPREHSYASGVSVKNMYEVSAQPLFSSLGVSQGLAKEVEPRHEIDGSEHAHLRAPDSFSPNDQSVSPEGLSALETGLSQRTELNSHDISQLFHRQECLALRRSARKNASLGLKAQAEVSNVEIGHLRHAPHPNDAAPPQARPPTPKRQRGGAGGRINPTRSFPRLIATDLKDDVQRRRFAALLAELQDVPAAPTSISPETSDILVVGQTKETAYRGLQNQGRKRHKALHPTFKYLGALAAGLWIVDFEWVTDALLGKVSLRAPDAELGEYEITGLVQRGESNKPRDSRLRHAKGMPPLLKGVRFVLANDDSESSTDRAAQLCHLIKLGGGSVIDSASGQEAEQTTDGGAVYSDDPFGDLCEETIILVVLAGSSQHQSSATTRAKFLKEREYASAQILKDQWLLDSIASYKKLHYDADYRDDPLSRPTAVLSPAPIANVDVAALVRKKQGHVGHRSSRQSFGKGVTDESSGNAVDMTVSGIDDRSGGDSGGDDDDDVLVVPNPLSVSRGKQFKGFNFSSVSEGRPSIEDRRQSGKRRQVSEVDIEAMMVEFGLDNSQDSPDLHAYASHIQEKFHQFLADNGYLAGTEAPSDLIKSISKPLFDLLWDGMTDSRTQMRKVEKHGFPIDLIQTFITEHQEMSTKRPLILSHWASLQEMGRQGR